MDLISRFDEFLTIWNTCTGEERDRIRTFVMNGEMPATDAGTLEAQALEVLQFLNERAGHNYRPTRVNLDLILARLREGYTPTQCRQVIVRKCRDWLGNPERAPFLRPATLFNRTKFNQYVGQLVAPTVHERGGFLSAMS